ncbi:hypothetical protein MMPV_002155 [Pyropia vietnamensis]
MGCVGPYFGTGVGFSALPPAVVFGAGAGVGMVCGVGWGGGAVVGSGGSAYLPVGVSSAFFYAPRLAWMEALTRQVALAHAPPRRRRRAVTAPATGDAPTVGGPATAGDTPPPLPPPPSPALAPPAAPPRVPRSPRGRAWLRTRWSVAAAAVRARRRATHSPSTGQLRPPSSSLPVLHPHVSTAKVPTNQGAPSRPTATAAAATDTDVATTADANTDADADADADANADADAAHLDVLRAEADAARSRLAAATAAARRRRRQQLRDHGEIRASRGWTRPFLDGPSRGPALPRRLPSVGRPERGVGRGDRDAWWCRPFFDGPPPVVGRWLGTWGGATASTAAANP